MITVISSLQVAGIHHWPDCPLYDVSYLRDLHRHVFHIKVEKLVDYSREVEIIMLKQDVEKYLMNHYGNEDKTICNFGSMSCENIAEELMGRFNLISCEVLEDGENGARIDVR